MNGGLGPQLRHEAPEESLRNLLHAPAQRPLRLIHGGANGPADVLLLLLLLLLLRRLLLSSSRRRACLLAEARRRLVVHGGGTVAAAAKAAAIQAAIQEARHGSH